MIWKNLSGLIKKMAKKLLSVAITILAAVIFAGLYLAIGKPEYFRSLFFGG